MKRCHSCRRELVISLPPGRTETCPACGADLRCCLNCTFYDEAAYNNCREGQAERVLQKDRANFCEFFRFRDESSLSVSPSGATRQKLDDLFRRK